MPLVDAAPAIVRQQVREGNLSGPTCGLAIGFAQANVVILPADWADEFAAFCRLNPQPCPLLERMAAGNPRPQQAAVDADLRTDVPRYRVFRQGMLEPVEPTDIRHLWRDDLVGFLLGCSFTFERALQAAGLRMRHWEEGCNVSMYRTSIPCRPAGRWQAQTVVSMRPFAAGDVEAAVRISGEFPRMHGAPIHVGEPGIIGVHDLSRPDFGDPVSIGPAEVPLFWACGVTPQLAILNARPELAITHSPGCMFVTDWPDESFRQIPPAIPQ